MSSDNESLSGNEADRNSETESINNIQEERNDDETPVQENQQDEPKDADDSEAKKKEVKPKRKLLNQPKFDTQTIRNSKGLPAINGHFKDVKFKGKGYEEQDLTVLMKTYEYWCHRFYPKFTFDDTIARFEWLGNKKGTQVYLTKIRMGLEDLIEEDKQIASDDEIGTEGFVEPNTDEFDKLLPVTTNEPEPTEEQLEMIRQNRLRAEAIRRERMSKIGDMSSQVSNLQTQSKEHSDEITEQEQELGLDNILDMVNEDQDEESTSVVDSELEACKQKMAEERVSKAIRKNVVASDSDDQEENVCQSKPFKSNELEGSDNSQNHTSDRDASMSDKSVVSQISSIVKKKKLNGRTFDKSSLKSVSQNGKISDSESDDELNQTASTSQVLFQSKHKSNKPKKKHISDSEDEGDDVKTSEGNQSSIRNKKEKYSDDNKSSSDSESLKKHPKNNKRVISDDDSDDTSSKSSQNFSNLKRRSPEANTDNKIVLSNDNDVSKDFNPNQADSDGESLVSSKSSQIISKKRRIIKSNSSSSDDSVVLERSDSSRKQKKKKKKISTQQMDDDTGSDSYSNNATSNKKDILDSDSELRTKVRISQ